MRLRKIYLIFPEYQSLFANALGLQIELCNCYATVMCFCKSALKIMQKSDKNHQKYNWLRIFTINLYNSQRQNTPRKSFSDLSKTSLSGLSQNFIGKARILNIKLALLQQQQLIANKSCRLIIEAKVLYFRRKQLQKQTKLAHGGKKSKKQRLVS